MQAPNGLVTQKVMVEAVAPALFEGAIVRSDGVCASKEAPVRPGETLSLYATGIGSGSDVMIEWDGRPLPAQASALPGLNAVSIVTFTVPDESFTDASVRLLAAGKRSNAVEVPGS